MLNNPTIEILKSMKLHSMLQAFSEQLNNPCLDLGFESRMAVLVELEWNDRENRKMTRRLSQAKLQQPACFENIDY